MELAKLSDTVTSTGLMKSYSTFESKAALKSEITDEREISLLEDLKKYKAIPTKSMTSILSVKEIELPKKIKDTLNHKMKNQSLVLRSDLLILEEIPPTDGFCQICGGEFEGDSFFQCVSCSRFVCTPHYIDLIAVGSAFCPNCRGDLFTLPFTCKGCELDFNQTKDFNIHKKKCPLCGYTLPSQEDLVKKRVGEKNLILKKDLPPTVDDKNAKKIWKGI